ncbi:hypothetical protein [Nocardia sp. BMG111209]|uniref:hypothetical protein n=1 Tax=Nocardia sp. BMG111209 TaxID=1160137 RepID=UPI00037B7AE9|nr:hypothetical protein [Nocardia sp. BMG111209]
MAEAEPEDPLLQWRSGGSLNPAVGYGVLAGGLTLIACAMLTVLVVTRSGSAPTSPLMALTALYAFSAVCVGAGFWFGYLYGRRTVIELRVETEDTGKTLTLHSWDGQIHRVPLPEIENVRVTRNTTGSPSVLGIKVYVGDKRYRTVQGPNADALMNVLRSGGVNVTTHDRQVSDGP